MQTWAKVGAGFIAVVAVLVGMQAAKGRPEISWQCNAKGGAGDCRIENKGGAVGEVQFDAVLICRDGEHKAHVAARVEPHNHTTKIIEGFAPSVGMLTTCAGLDYRNAAVK